MESKNYNDFKEYVLFPALFENISTAFPTMEFRRAGDRWISKHHLDETTDSNRKDITYIYRSSSFCAKDQARDESRGLIDLFMDINGCQFQEAIERLSAICNVSAPSRNDEQWKRYEELQQNREKANEAFKAALWNGSEDAARVLDYLRNVRKWTDAEIKEEEIGLATTDVICSLDDAASYKTNGVGTTHIISIPYRNGSRIFGFKFRVVGEPKGDEPKYKNSYGLHKGNGLFKIGVGVTDLVIVEGELDALHASAKGVSNIAATAGGAASTTQIDDAVKRGVEKFTLLFDNDTNGRKFIDDTAINVRSICDKKIYVAVFPEGCKDTDEYLQQHSVEDFNKIIENAIPYSLYSFNKLVEEYQRKQSQEGAATWKDRDDFFAQVRDMIVADNSNAKLIYDCLENSQEALHFSLADYMQSIDRRILNEEKAKEGKRIKRTLGEINKLLEEGSTDEAIKLMQKAANKQTTVDKATEYTKVFAPMTPDQCSKYLSEIREGVPTGYEFIEGTHIEKLTLNSGLTFICGYRGHGKTSFLNNIAINDATRNIELKNNKKTLYFSYEVDKRRLMIDLLNTYVNDREIGKNPSESMQGYFRGEGCKYFKNGRRADGKTHYEYFLEKKDIFFRDYMGGTLTIVEENYKVEQLLDAIKFYMAANEISIICIDYAQLLYSKDFSRQRTEEIKKVVNDLKDFANKAGVPIVLAAQFNREVYSPISVDTKNIGEGGDFERIADTCIGLFNLKEFYQVPTDKEEQEACKLLSRLMGKTIKKAERIEGKLFVRLMKRRYGYFPIDTILDWEGRTKYIKPNVEKIDNLSF